MRRLLPYLIVVIFITAAFQAGRVFAWTPLPVTQDPLVRMPGTQPGQVSMEAANRCMNCHSGYDQDVEPGYNWQGSMMAQAARDFLFFACLTVAGQDSVFALGNPNAMDLCMRCHFPKGWLEGRSDPPNASAMTGADWDGVQCDFCHTMFDPHFKSTHAGTREGSDWLGYWDETNASSTPSQPAANTTLQADTTQANSIRYFSNAPFYTPEGHPASTQWTESASGQYFVSSGSQKRASFADATARHQMLYSRYHKSKYFCAPCHDVSNPALANLAYKDARPGDNVLLPSETDPAHSYYHIERTFSEFMLSDFGQQGGSPGRGYFSPENFKTSKPGNVIATCQDCHMRDVRGHGADKKDSILRPDNSIEHPKSGQPLHDLVGANAWVSYVLASTVTGSPNYDATNRSLLYQGANVLTLTLTQGLGINAPALLAGVERAKGKLQSAASIQQIRYDKASGELTFRVQNNTGHKLISGFPEGRRMFINVRAYQGDNLVYEVNPYDYQVGTLKGLDPAHAPSSPPLSANEQYVDELVYEMNPSSAITGEDKTFHFALATGRYKDNRIPPKGFRISEAQQRLCEPVWGGSSAPNYFSPEEYAGGYHQAELMIPPGADRVTVQLYYQTTSREYIEFLRDQINGTGNLTLPPEAYIIQTDPFFSKLKAWGNTIWQLWTHNKDVPGAKPIMMAQAEGTAFSPLASVKQQPNGTTISTGNVVVTAVFGNAFYVETDNRATGIRVEMANHGVTQDMRVDFTGVVRTNSNGERYVEADSIVQTGTGFIEPLFIGSKALGGSNWMYDAATGAGQQGVRGGTGLNNIGLLVTVWGRVTHQNTGFIYVDDGANLSDGSGHYGVRVDTGSSGQPALGTYAIITGISSGYRPGDFFERLVLQRP